MNLHDDDFEYVRTVLRERTAIALGPGRRYLVEGRLRAFARRERVSVRDLFARIRTGGDRSLEARLVEAMITQETSFFRDPQVFEALRATLLPGLLKKRESTRELALWCAASATGQEPYSLAMLLREHFPELRGWRVLLLASDVSGSALARAERGRFRRSEARRGLPDRYREKYFEIDDEGFRIVDDLKKTIRFRKINLARDWPDLPGMDLILMRNVLIYFDVDTKREILHKAKKVLRDDGHLFLGAAETTFSVDDEYERVQVGGTSCYRVRTRKGEGSEQGDGHAGVHAIAGEAARRG